MIAYITGTSAGIGKALAENLLNAGHTVIGMSRRHSIEHGNYEHITIDLADINAVNRFEFQMNLKDDIILVNNAGIIGAVKPIGHQIGEELIEMANVNILAPQILMNKFINKFQSIENTYQILNISSGAGKYAIDAWAPYCASKAALDLFSETIALELKSHGHHNWHVFSVAPGVVDTAMQAEIRASNPSEFLNRQKFIDLKQDNELTAPSFVATQLSKIISNPEQFQDVIFSVRDMG